MHGCMDAWMHAWMDASMHAFLKLVESSATYESGTPFETTRLDLIDGTIDSVIHAFFKQSL